MTALVRVKGDLVRSTVAKAHQIISKGDGVIEKLTPFIVRLNDDKADLGECSAKGPAPTLSVRKQPTLSQ